MYMINLDLLEKLVAFAKYGSLLRVAEELHTSQPALSRSMKQIEEELHVTLFERKKNQLSLTKTGLYAAQQAEYLLNEARNYEQRVAAYERSLRTIAIGYCSTVPQIVLSSLVSQYYSEMTITSTMRDDDTFLDELLHHSLQIAVVHAKPEDDRFYYQPCGKEQLYFTVSPSSPFAFYPEIRFSDINGTPMLLYQNIGFWEQVVRQQMPDSLFITQSQQEAFNELLNSSEIAGFSSSYFVDRNMINDNRIQIPIADSQASTTFYLVCLKEERKRFEQLFQHITATTVA